MQTDQYGLTLVTGPAFEPMSLDQVKLHLKVEDHADDTLIQSLITSAREYAEIFLARRLITQTWDLTLDEFPGTTCEIKVPYPPLQSVSAITYVDTGGTSQTLATANYTVDAASQPGRIYPAYGLLWPATRSQRNAVTIRHVVGFGRPASVPESVKAAMKLLIGNWYENRESTLSGTIIGEVPMAVQNLLYAHRQVEV